MAKKKLSDSLPGVLPVLFIQPKFSLEHQDSACWVCTPLFVTYLHREKRMPRKIYRCRNKQVESWGFAEVVNVVHCRKHEPTVVAYMGLGGVLMWANLAGSAGPPCGFQMGEPCRLLAGRGIE